MLTIQNNIVMQIEKSFIKLRLIYFRQAKSIFS